MSISKINHDSRIFEVEAIFAVKTNRRYCLCRRDRDGKFWELISNERVFGDGAKDVSESIYEGKVLEKGIGKCCALRGGGVVYADGTVIGPAGDALVPGKDGKVRIGGRMVKVAFLVAEAFLPTRIPGMDYVRHKDGDKDNNNAENLEWSFDPEDRSVFAVRRCDEKGKNAVVFRSVKSAAKDRGVSIQAIYQFAHGIKKDSKGFIWTFLA